MNGYVNPLYVERRFNYNNNDDASSLPFLVALILRLFWSCVIWISHLTFKLPSFPFHSHDEASLKQSSFPCKLLCLTPRVTLLHYFIWAAQVAAASTGEQTKAENTGWHQSSEISLAVARSSDVICFFSRLSRLTDAHTIILVAVLITAISWFEFPPGCYLFHYTREAKCKVVSAFNITDIIKNKCVEMSHHGIFHCHVWQRLKGAGVSSPASLYSFFLSCPTLWSLMLLLAKVL